MASSYGAAGSVVVFLLWVYYSALIILFGAQLTQTFARRRGGSIHPAAYAVAVPRQC
ncbi:MAG: YhjD/YihY/BrkB family envelope integrity protein [bacterium]